MARVIDGFIKNNTGKGKHIWKMNVRPGQSVPLQYVFDIYKNKLEGVTDFIGWLQGKVPVGWEIVVKSDRISELAFSETGDALPVEVLTYPGTVSKDGVLNHKELDVLEDDRDENFSWQYVSPKVLRNLTAKQIADLKMNDNPKRVLDFIDSVPKLRRALTISSNNPRKATLTALIRRRLKQLAHM